MRPATRLSGEVVALAKGQRGLVTAAQLAGIGLTPKQVAALVSAGLLEHLERNVYRLAGAVPGYVHDALRAVLAIGEPVAVSHGSAARVWGFDELGEGLIEVTLPPGRRTTRRCARVHRRALPPGDVVAWRGLPVTAPARVLADLVLEPYDSRFLGRVVDHFFRLRVLTARSLLVAIGGLSWHPGHVALARMADLHLDGLRVRGRPPDSDRERDVERMLVRAALPAPVRQHPVDCGDHLLFIDLALVDDRVAIEYDGFAAHSGRFDFDDDRRKADDLTALGWRVVLVTSAMSEPEVVRRVSRAVEGQRSLRQLRSGQPPA
ncbi:MAG TPA: type IV toxin-antitoxin system AbiEi family antitoxin domain-containing protein [Acidimicrobiales bacterium]|nr:type IV toxin-antitoxin system AbiEi family antitoxin domain-containing protein [Acidimicrobiales bacterium]